MLDRLQALIPSREQLLANRWLKILGPFVGDPKLWHWSRRTVALGVSIGIFFGFLIPVAQIPVSAVAAVALRANLPMAAASTLVTNPFTFAPVYYGAYHLGRLVTGNDIVAAPAAAPEQPDDASLFTRIQALGAPLIVGLAIVACIAGIASYLLITLFWIFHVRRKRRRRLGAGVEK